MCRPLLITLWILALLPACKKDPSPRTTKYTLNNQGMNSLNGSVYFTENPLDQASTKVFVEVGNTQPHILYQAHLHDGPPSRYFQVQYHFGLRASDSSTLTFDTLIPISYDSAIRYDGTFVLHNSTRDSVLAFCGVGKNK